MKLLRFATPLSKLLICLFCFAATTNVRAIQSTCFHLGGVDINAATEQKLDQLVLQAETLLTKEIDHLEIHLIPRGDGSQAYQLARAAKISERLREKMAAAKLPSRRFRFHWVYDAVAPDHIDAIPDPDCDRLPNLAISIEPIPLKRD